MPELFATDWRDLWTDGASQEPVGAVFTKVAIVDLILDLAGYVPTKRLAAMPLLEPSCGDGAFLRAAVDRLLQSKESAHGFDWGDDVLSDALRAADINGASVAAARSAVASQLMVSGCPAPRAASLSETWIAQTDFLLSEWPFQFEFVIGNPPYVRLEDVPRNVLARYRELFSTTTDRADLYVAFFEKGLQLLTGAGTLAYICANRFTKNKYGRALRSLIAHKYRVRHYINLEHTQPFESEVSAYPAIVVIDRSHGAPTRAATLDDIGSDTLERVRIEALGPRRPRTPVTQFDSWYPQGEPWMTTSDEEHELLARLNREYPVLEASAPDTKVGIGVATGADSVFVLKAQHPEIEESRQLPLVMSSDVKNDRVTWSGRFLLNPFADEDDGTLVDLRHYPGLAGYLHANAVDLKARHVAKSRPATWYRTIDRIWPALRTRPKLLIPDIQGATTIGQDPGHWYPHHNLYWITSGAWPLASLKALLRSSLVLRQVRAYSVQMRGGSLRFQAQTLRRLRLPPLQALSDTTLERLAQLAGSPVQAEIDEAAEEAFGQRV